MVHSNVWTALAMHGCWFWHCHARSVMWCSAAVICILAYVEAFEDLVMLAFEEDSFFGSFQISGKSSSGSRMSCRKDQGWW
mmetsp:Transcript_400/g.777  ORF Transcript_400/g.777 Transcript_400/m.777 type:complete len:81 (+) Transcript_400:57-299(+)